MDESCSNSDLSSAIETRVCNNISTSAGMSSERPCRNRRPPIIFGRDNSPTKMRFKRSASNNTPSMNKKFDVTSDDAKPPKKKANVTSDNVTAPKKQANVTSDDTAPPKKQFNIMSDNATPSLKESNVTSDDATMLSKKQCSVIKTNPSKPGQPWRKSKNSKQKSLNDAPSSSAGETVVGVAELEPIEKMGPDESVTANVELVKPTGKATVVADLTTRTFATAAQTIISILQDAVNESDQQKGNNEKEMITVSVMDLFESDMNAEKENDEDLIGELTAVDKVVDLHALAQLPQSTPIANSGNIDRLSVMRTPPASILRHLDSPRSVGRRVHFDVEITGESGNPLKRWPKFGPISPAKSLSPLQRSSPGLAALSPIAQQRSHSASLLRRRPLANTQRSVKNTATDTAQSTIKKSSTASPLTNVFMTQIGQKEVSSMNTSEEPQPAVVAFMPDYVGLTDPISPKICQMLAPYTGSKSLMGQLQLRGIKTVGELARLSEVDLSPLLIKAQPTKVGKARSVLNTLYASQVTVKSTPAAVSTDFNVISALSTASSSSASSQSAVVASPSLARRAESPSSRERLSAIAQRMDVGKKLVQSIEDTDSEDSLLALLSTNLTGPSKAATTEPVDSSSIANTAESTSMNDSFRSVIEWDIDFSSVDNNTIASRSTSNENNLHKQAEHVSSSSAKLDDINDKLIVDELEDGELDSTQSIHEVDTSLTVANPAPEPAIEIANNSLTTETADDSSVSPVQPDATAITSLSDDDVQIVGGTLVGEPGKLVRMFAECSKSVSASNWTREVNTAAFDLVKTLMRLINVSGGKPTGLA